MYKKSKTGIFLVLFFLIFSLCFAQPAEASWFSKAVKKVTSSVKKAATAVVSTVAKTFAKAVCWVDDNWLGGDGCNWNTSFGGGKNNTSSGSGVGGVGGSNSPPPCTYSCSGDNKINSCGGSELCSYGCLGGTCNICPNGICPTCGGASSDFVDSIPTSNFCSPGSPSRVSIQLGGRAWEWQCSNSYNGNVKALGCSSKCIVGKWVCDSKCISIDSPCKSECVGSRQLIGKVCAGSDKVTGGTVGVGSANGPFLGFGDLDNSSIPQITLAARVPNGEWKQVTSLTNFILTSGKNIELAWAVVNVSMSGNCSDSSKFFNNIPVSTGSSTDPLTQSQTFTLTCKNDSGTDTKTVKVIIPAYSEF